MQSTLNVENLTVKYRNFSINNITFTLNEGDILGIAGSNGSGKTTLVETIMGIRNLFSGNIYYKNINVIDNFSIIKENAMIISSDIPFFPNMSVIENLELICSFCNYKGETIEKLKRVNLLNHKDVLYKNLSKGMKHRLAFAEYLIRKPELIIMDEPTEGLDPAFKADVIEILNSIKEHNGISTSAILVTHDIDLLSKICTNIILLSDGKIMDSGKFEEIIYKFQESYIILDSDIQTLRGLVNNFDSYAIPVGLNSFMLPLKFYDALKDKVNIRKPESQDIFRRDNYV